MHCLSEIPDLFRVLNAISQKLAQTRETNLLFPRSHVFSCVLYKKYFGTSLL